MEQKQNNRSKGNKPSPITLNLNCENFDDALFALRTAHPAIIEIFGDNDNFLTVDQANIKIAEALIKHTPLLLDKKNIHWSVLLQSNKCSVRTEDFISFGWNIFYEIVDNRANTLDVNLTFTISNGDVELKNKLLEYGWVIAEEKRKPNYNTYKK